MKNKFNFKAVIFFITAFCFYNTKINSNEISSDVEISEKDDSINRIITYIDIPLVEQRQVLTSNQIQNTKTSTFTELLESTGIQIKSYGTYGNSTTPSVRGFTGSTIKIVIDGVCVNSSQNGTFDFTTIDINSIEKLEIVRGSFIESPYTDGGCSTIFITTKKQTLGHNFNINTNLKTYFNQPIDTYTLKLGYDGQIANNSFLKITTKGVYAKNEFPFIYNKKIKKVRENNNVKDLNFNSTFSQFFNNGSSLSLTETFYTGNKNIPGPVNSTTPGIQKDNNNNFLLNINIPKIKNISQFTTNINWISNNQNYLEANTESIHNLNTITINSSFFQKFNKFYKHSIGINSKFSNITSTDVGYKNHIEGFIKYTPTFNFSKYFSITTPLSVAFYNTTFVPIPKLGIKAQINNFSILFNINRIYLFPDLNQLYWKQSASAKGNPNLKPEEGLSSELTFNYKNKIIPFSLCFFTNYYFNKIQWQPVNSIWTPTNVASAFYAGINFIAEKTLFNCLTLKLNYEYLHNSLLREGSSYKKRIMYTPEHVLSFSLFYTNNYFNIYSDLHYVSKRYTSNLNINYLKPYYLINLSFELNTIKTIKPYLKINNLLNQSYEQTESYPMPGISLELGFNLKF